MRTARTAFTLVELLVVIGIIAVLVAILLPALARARDSAKTIKCLSNVRQLGVATQMYINDSGGFLPMWGYYKPGPGGVTDPVGDHRAIMEYDWTTTLAGYLGKRDFVYDKSGSRPVPDISAKNKLALYMCPLTGSEEIDRASNAWRAPRTYAISYYSSAAAAYSWRPYTMVKANRWISDEFIMFADVNGNCPDSGAGATFTYYFGKFSDMNMVAFRHGKRSDKNESLGGYTAGVGPKYKTQGKANAVFLDGHALSLDWKEFMRLNLSPANAARSGISNMFANPQP